jgi:hypothetical protein
LEISTDDFPAAQQHIATENNKDFHPAIPMPYPVFGSDEPLTTNALHFIFPPPGDIAKSGIDLLTFICIFRI